MAQILEPVPSFAQSLARNLGQGLSSGMNSILQNRLNARREDKENKTLSEQLGGDFSNLSPDIKKILVQEIIKMRATDQENLYKRLAKQEEQRIKKEEEEAENEGLKETLDWLDENAGYVGQTGMLGLLSGEPKSFLGSFPGTKAYETRKEIDLAGFLSADKVYTHFNKGTVTDAKLDVIKNDIAPNSRLSEREYKARVSAMRRIMNLPRNTSRAQFEKVVDGEAKALKKIGSSKDKSKKSEIDPSQFWE